MPERHGVLQAITGPNRSEDFDATSFAAVNHW
jgi:hypothetical protein